jgi:hypothetical protein
MATSRTQVAVKKRVSVMPSSITSAYRQSAA